MTAERSAPGRGAHDEGQAGRSRGSGPSSPQTTAQERPGGFWHFMREMLLIGLTALVISFVIKTFVVQAFWIPSGSMEQTLQVGDRVLVSKIQAGALQVERGDIVVFEDPGGWMPPVPQVDRGPVLNAAVDLAQFVGVVPVGENHLIKRVIGVGGDRVVCCDDAGRITLNGVPLEEPYLADGDRPSLETFEVTVPPDSYWVMGDHRSNSRDSRFNDDGTGATGSVPADSVVGQAAVLVWPLSRLEWLDRPAQVFADVPQDQS